MKMRILYILLITAAFTGCKSPEARKPVTRSSGSYLNESVMRNRELVAREEAAILEHIEQDTSNDYIASQNGFWYFYNTKATDSTELETPEFGDVVRFDYSIKSLDGDVIYAEGEIPTRRYAMDKEELFGGLREGLKLMKEGEVVTFLFPSHKAFGYYGDKDRIGTNVPIITKVELHSIFDETRAGRDNK